ncbi:MAG: hypothetical protein Alpg2KO_02070 [Alphaproteobacteria bacterium]
MTHITKIEAGMDALSRLTAMGKTLSIALVASTVLSACSTTNTGAPAQREVEPQLETTKVDPVSNSLVSAAERTSDALDRLSLVEQARTPVPDPGPIGDVPPGLDTRLAVSWVGPIAPLLSRLSAAGGYRFRMLGKPPTVPVIVDINADDEMLVEILRDVGHQAASRAMISVDAAAKLIEVRYAQ